MPICLLTMATLRNYETIMVIALLSLLSRYGASQPNFVDKFCLSRDNFTVNSTYHTNLNLVLSNLTAQSSTSRFYNSTSGIGLNKVFALYYCRGDVISEKCNECAKAAAEKTLEVCPNQREAIVWYQECTLHYAKEFIFSALEIEPLAALYSISNVSDPFPLSQLLNVTMEGLITQAAHNRSSQGFATGKGILTSFDSLYGLVPCTSDILGEPCEVCLRIALGEVPVCCGVGRVMVMIFLPSCQLRYGLTPFYSINTTPPVTSLPSPSPAFVSNPTPSNKPTIYQIPLPILGQSGGTILTSGNNFKLQTTMALGFLVLLGNSW